MSQNELSAIAVAIFIGFALLRGLARMLRSLGKADRGDGGMARIDAVAKRILREQQAARSSVPATTGALGTAAKAKPRPARSAASLQKVMPKAGASSAVLAKTRNPAVVRTGLLSGGKEPVIQRRR
ncbi:MAG TPA: hypothetical protein VHA35_09120 [Dongiaceae bacterium]|nr:hypothetical protein [Dongiaceae bacterium]